MAGLLLASFVVFAPALEGELVSDDLNAIASNHYVTGRGTLAEIFGSFSWWGAARADAPGYRPLTTWTFAVNHDLAGAAVPSWHAFNIALHALVSWLVYLLAKELGGRTSSAVAAGSLFSVLPIHVESVAWVVGRAELLAALGYALGLLCVLRYRRVGDSRYVVAAALLIALGSFAKENAATLLAAPVLAAIVLPSGARERRRDATMFVALAVGLVAYAVVRFYAASGVAPSGAAGDLLDNPLASLPLMTRLLGAISVLGRYLTLTVWPHPLSIDYSFDALGIGAGFVADRYSVVALIGTAGLAIAAYRLGRRATFALLLAAACYSLVSNTVLLIGTVMAERLFYLPTVGLVLAAVPAFDLAARPRIREVALVAVALVCLAYATLSYRRAGDWRDGIAIFESATRAHPRSARARMELGGAYGRAGRVADAEREFALSVEILPTYAAAWYNLGNLRARGGRLDAAATAYRHALEHTPTLVQAWYNLGLVEQMRGRPHAAIDAFSAAAEIAPGDVEVKRALAALRAEIPDIANPPSGR